MVLQITEPIVSVDWLNKNINTTNLIILDASINKVTQVEKVDENLQIVNARYFDLKNKFSNVSAPFPNTVPSEEQFTEEAQKLGINDDSLIVVYDNKGIYSCARAWYLFKAFGFNNIAVLDGGLPEWIQSGYDTENEKKEINYTKGNFIAKYNSNFFYFFNDIEIAIQDDQNLIIDARSQDRFEGLVEEPRKGLRSGHIPNSVCFPYKSLFNGNCLKSKTEIIEIFENIVEHNNKQLIFSCGSGVTACILYLAATISGYQRGIIYDGSWTEYGSLTT